MRPSRIACAGLLLAGLALPAVKAAPTPKGVTTETVKDRKSFVPHNKYQPLPGKVVGVLVSDVVRFMATEGRSSRADAQGFSAGGNSYRWIYVPDNVNPAIRNFRVKIGAKGEGSKIYPGLSMCAPPAVRTTWGIDVPYALVEAQVNDGEGAPAEQTFVATNMKRLDGTPAFPAKLPDVVNDLKKRYAASLKDRQKKIDEALAEVQKKHLKNRKVTGPKQTEELFYITYLPDSQRVRVCFRTKISDGSYQYMDVGRGRPIPLPVPPRDKGPFFRPPPPPPPFPGFKVRYGLTFGVELGLAYEVDKNGKVVKIEKLAVESFAQETPPPPGIRRLPPAKRPADLPPLPALSAGN
jgi:hypothetical protein